VKILPYKPQPEQLSHVDHNRKPQFKPNLYPAGRSMKQAYAKIVLTSTHISPILISTITRKSSHGLSSTNSQATALHNNQVGFITSLSNLEDEQKAETFASTSLTLLQYTPNVVLLG
jgi:hypothetical protein